MGAGAGLPQGFKVVKLVKFKGMPIKFAGVYEYNFADDLVGPNRVI